MLRNENDLIINGISIPQYLTSISIEYNKMWGSDTGRNTLSGKYSGTLLGIFPKFVCTFRKLTESEIELLVPVLDSANQNVTYYDPYKKTTITISTYCGDYALGQKKLFSNIARKGEPFTISFIATDRRR